MRMTRRSFLLAAGLGGTGLVARASSARCGPPMLPTGAPVPGADSSYTQDCGTCHLAYPPGLLPARSWNRILDTLDDHFGENAELPAADRERAFLTQNAADRIANKRSRRVIVSLHGATPTRITEVP